MVLPDRRRKSPTTNVKSQRPAKPTRPRAPSRKQDSQLFFPVAKREESRDINGVMETNSSRDIAFVALIRNPLEQAVSHYRHVQALFDGVFSSFTDSQKPTAVSASPTGCPMSLLEKFWS